MSIYDSSQPATVGLWRHAPAPLLFDVKSVTGGQYVVSFPIYEVPVRYSTTLPWTIIRVEESEAASGGTWTQLVQGAIAPVELDPQSPRALGVTVVGATLADGWYRVTFIDAAGAKTVVPPISLAHDGSPVAPSMAEVSALMLNMVTDADDNRIAEFGDSSNPTADQVITLIDTVREEVATRLVSPIPARFSASARYVVAMGTVAYILQAVYPESVNDSGSSYSTTRTIFLARLADLQRAVRADFPVLR